MRMVLVDMERNANLLMELTNCVLFLDIPSIKLKCVKHFILMELVLMEKDVDLFITHQMKTILQKKEKKEKKKRNPS
jgi:predicted peroxiredoxin